MYVWNQGVTRESECVMLEADLSIESTREALRLRLSGYMFAGVVSVGVVGHTCRDWGKLLIIYVIKRSFGFKFPFIFLEKIPLLI